MVKYLNALIWLVVSSKLTSIHTHVCNAAYEWPMGKDKWKRHSATEVLDTHHSLLDQCVCYLSMQTFVS